MGIEIRQYAIKASPVGIDRRVRRLIQSKIPNLNKVQDIADYIVGNSNATISVDAASDSDPEDAKEIQDKAERKVNIKIQRRQVQERNVERKRKAQEDKREGKKQRKEERENAAMDDLRNAAVDDNDLDDDDNLLNDDDDDNLLNDDDDDVDEEEDPIDDASIDEEDVM